MDTLQFVAALVNALVWPCVFVFVILLFRSTLRDLMRALVRRLRMLTRIAAYGVSVDFESQAKALREEIAAQSGAQVGAALDVRHPGVRGGMTGPGAAEVEGEVERLKCLGEVVPRAAVTEAYVVMQQRVAAAARAVGWADDTGLGRLVPALVHLRDRAALDPMWVDAGVWAQRLHEGAVRSEDLPVTHEAALNYVSASMAIADATWRCVGGGGVPRPTEGSRIAALARAANERSAAVFDTEPSGPVRPGVAGGVRPVDDESGLPVVDVTIDGPSGERDTAWDEASESVHTTPLRESALDMWTSGATSPVDGLWSASGGGGASPAGTDEPGDAGAGRYSAADRPPLSRMARHARATRARTSAAGGVGASGAVPLRAVGLTAGRPAGAQPPSTVTLPVVEGGAPPS